MAPLLCVVQIELRALNVEVCTKLLIAERQFGYMVALQPPTIAAVPLKEAIATPKRVPLDSDTIATARDIGISLGD